MMKAHDLFARTYSKAIIDYRVDAIRKLEHLRQRSRESGSIALREQVVQ
jgi:hypothetical protein